jgi:hypothetical protein
MELITGLKLGRWELLDRDDTRPYHWWCLCTCGNERSVRGDKLRHGHSKSCGCSNAQSLADGIARTHGLSHTIEYKHWKMMKQRVKRDPAYIIKGLKVCDRWLDRFEDFLIDMGPKPEGKYSIGRIDNERGYGPWNCRWETPTQQNNNKGDTVRLTSEKFGTKPQMEWLNILIGHTNDTSWTAGKLKMVLTVMTLDQFLGGIGITDLSTADCADQPDDYAGELVAA